MNKYFSLAEIQTWDRFTRANFINTLTGFKSLSLIGTVNKAGESNVAVFSNIVHLGADPALIGFIMRPTTVPRDTYKNIKETGFFSINHVTVDMIEDAHHSSANYDMGISEFEKTNLEEEYKTDIEIPFVKGSPVQLYCKYLNEYHIKENDTIHIIASIERLFFEEELQHEDGWLQLDKGKVVTVNGLDGYCLPKLVDRLKYARKNQPTESFLK